MTASERSFVPMEFRLAGTPNGRTVTLALLIMAALGQAAFLGWYAAGGTSLGRALTGGAFVAVLVALFIWSFRSYGRGTVKLSADGLVIETFTVKQKFKWDHIADVQLEARPSAMSLAPFHASHAPNRVKISLSRSLRLPFLPRRAGTDTPGIPSLVAKTVRLQVDDPDGFMSAVRPFLSPNTESAGLTGRQLPPTL